MQHLVFLFYDELAPGREIISVDEVTEGAACSKKFINNLDQLMIANSDQYVDININNY